MIFGSYAYDLIKIEVLVKDERIITELVGIVRNRFIESDVLSFLGRFVFRVR